MSKIKAEGYSIGPLQKRIILRLAKGGPQTINETARNMKPKGHYKSTNTAFHTLEKEEIIKRVGVKEYRNRSFPTFWLTEKGIVYALVHKAKPDILQDIYGKLPAFSIENYEILDFLCELAETSPHEKLYEIYTALKMIKKTNNRILGQAIYRIVMNNDVIRKVFEEALSFRKKFEEGVKP